MATLFLLANLLWIIQKDGRRAGQWNDLWFRHPENIVITVLAQVTQRTCYRVPNSSILRCVFYATGWASYMAGKPKKMFPKINDSPIAAFSLRFRHRLRDVLDIKYVELPGTPIGEQSG